MRLEISTSWMSRGLELQKLLTLGFSCCDLASTSLGSYSLVVLIPCRMEFSCVIASCPKCGNPSSSEHDAALLLWLEPSCHRHDSCVPHSANTTKYGKTTSPDVQEAVYQLSVQGSPNSRQLTSTVLLNRPLLYAPLSPCCGRLDRQCSAWWLTLRTAAVLEK